MIGLACKASSTKQSVNHNTSSVTRLMPSMSWKTRVTLRTRPPKRCGALGGLNFQVTLSCAKSVGAKRFKFFKQARSSFAVPTKLVQLSDQKVLGVPRREMKRTMPITHEQGTTSTCTALVLRQKKINLSARSNGNFKWSKTVHAARKVVAYTRGVRTVNRPKPS